MTIFTAFSPQLLADCVLLLIIYCIVGAIADPLRSVPGPILAMFTRFWYSRALAQVDFEKQNIELHRKHGK
jgi:hypothetical protein